MKVHEIIKKLDEKQLAMIADVILNKVEVNNTSEKIPIEQVQILNQLSVENKAEFARLLLSLLVEQDNKISKFVHDELIENENDLEEQREVEGETRAGFATIDIILIAATIIPLIQTKVNFHRNAEGKVDIKIEYDSKNLKNVLVALLKPIEELAKNIKKISIGKNFEIDNTDSKD